jgi:hypothetical protein
MASSGRGGDLLMYKKRCLFFSGSLLFSKASNFCLVHDLSIVAVYQIPVSRIDDQKYKGEQIDQKHYPVQDIGPAAAQGKHDGEYGQPQ